MQNVSFGDILHEMSKPIFWEKHENMVLLSSIKFTQSMIELNKKSAFS